VCLETVLRSHHNPSCLLLLVLPAFCIHPNFQSHAFIPKESRNMMPACLRISDQFSSEFSLQDHMLISSFSILQHGAFLVSFRSLVLLRVSLLTIVLSRSQIIHSTILPLPFRLASRGLHFQDSDIHLYSLALSSVIR
jgi:hypothetical protein